jgi:hypothetical protein
MLLFFSKTSLSSKEFFEKKQFDLASFFVHAQRINLSSKQ